MTSTGAEAARESARRGDGKFGAQPQSEDPAVTLTEPTVEPTVEPTEAQVEAMKAAARLFNDLDDLTSDLVDATEEHSLTYEVLRQDPQAASITVTSYDDGNGPDAYLVVRGAADEILDERIAPFRPAVLDREGYEDGITIDVAETRAQDLDALRVETVERISARLAETRPDETA